MKFSLYQSVAFMLREFNLIPFVFPATDDASFKIIFSVLPWLINTAANTHKKMVVVFFLNDEDLFKLYYSGRTVFNTT